MGGWHTGPMVGFDTETTGIDVEQDRIVTASLVHIRPGQPVERDAHMVAVDIDIPEQATAVHGITTDRARATGRPAADVLAEVVDVLDVTLTAGTPVVTMNGVYDLTILDRECRRWGVRPLSDRVPVAPVIDVRVLDKVVDRYRKGGRKLTDLCATYQVRIEEAHDSTWDALAACRVAWRICQRNPQIAGMDLHDLHRAQIGWHAEQQQSFAAYRRRIGQPVSDTDGAWPLRPHAAQLPVGEVG